MVHVGPLAVAGRIHGLQSVAGILERGVAEIRTESGEAFTGDAVDVGKHLRPNWRGGRDGTVRRAIRTGDALAGVQAEVGMRWRCSET